MNNKIIVLLFLFLSLWSCKSEYRPSAPQKETSLKKYSPSLSKINVPFVVKTSEVEKTLNTEITGVLYEDNSYTNNDNDNIKLIVVKHGGVKVSAQNDFIIYEVPLKINVKGRQPVLFTELTAKTDFEVKLKFKSKLNVDRKWNLTTKTEALGYDILNQPVLDFGIMSIPLEPVVRV